VELTTALHGLAHTVGDRKKFITDAAAYAAQFKLSDDQRDALVKLDVPLMVKMGAHPLVPFLANMQITHLRRSLG
jgi:2,3-dihydroxyphenylpropionate 1,2-dioxygenase